MDLDLVNRVELGLIAMQLINFDVLLLNGYDLIHIVCKIKE